MPSLDEDYLARREKQIEDLYMLRAMIVACLITGLIVGLLSVILLNSGRETLGAVFLLISLLFGAGSIFMVASYFAEKAADQAIQKEYELLALYGIPGEKPKRGGSEIAMSDDGELAEAYSLDEDKSTGKHLRAD